MAAKKSTGPAPRVETFEVVHGGVVHVVTRNIDTGEQTVEKRPAAE